MTDAAFGERLRQLREAAGLTQPALARKSGVPQSTIARYETGRSEPAWFKVVKLCAALGIPLTSFADDPAEQPGPARRKRKSK